MKQTLTFVDTLFWNWIECRKFPVSATDPKLIIIFQIKYQIKLQYEAETMPNAKKPMNDLIL